jgi:hypothetical protein
MSIYAKLVAAGLLLAALAGLFWKIDRAGYNRHKQESDAAAKDAVIKRVAENHDEELANQIQRIAIQKEHDDEIKNLRTRIAAADRLRIASPGCGPAGTSAPKGNGGGNGGDTGTRLVSVGTQQDFDALEFRVEQTFSGCRVAQEFIRKSGLAP